MFSISSPRGLLRALLAAGGVALAAATALTVVEPAAGETSTALPGQPGSLYAKAVLAAHPVGYWRLGEAKGTLPAKDASGHHRDGTYHGKPDLGQPGAIHLDKDTALVLDGPKS